MRLRARTDVEERRFELLRDTSRLTCSCAESRSSGSECDCTWLTARLRDGGIHGSDFQQLIEPWAEKGLVHLLRPLRESALWSEHHCIVALNVAAGAGTLMDLLMAFELPLAMNPVIAQAFEEEAVSAILDRAGSEPQEDPERSRARSESPQTTPASAHEEEAPRRPAMLCGGEAWAEQPAPEVTPPATDEYYDSRFRIERDGRGLVGPTPVASLVANYLVSDTMAAERLLHKLVEPMVVFKPTGAKSPARPPMLSEESVFPKTPWAPSTSQTASLGEQGDRHALQRT